MNNRTSTRKQSRARINVRMLRMNIPSRYRGECDGEWKCAVAARISMIRVNSAATGWTTRIAERVVLVLVGRSKVTVCDGVKDLARTHQVSHCPCVRQESVRFRPLKPNIPPKL